VLLPQLVFTVEVLTTRRCLSPLLARVLPNIGTTNSVVCLVRNSDRRTARRRKQLVDAVVRVPSVNLSSTARFRF
jgi:hypothetical protein